jgi:hypothetical protein
MKRYRHGAFLIFAVAYFLLSMAFLGLTQWDCPAEAAFAQCRASRPGAATVLILELALFLLIGWGLFRREWPQTEGGLDPGGSRIAQPDEWLQSDDGKLVVARLTAWGAAMTPLMVLLHLQSERRGESQRTQLGMTPEEARAIAAALCRMAEKIEEEAPRTLQ